MEGISTVRWRGLEFVPGEVPRTSSWATVITSASRTQVLRSTSIPGELTRAEGFFLLEVSKISLGVCGFFETEG